RRALTVVEVPRAACLCRKGSGEPHTDAMIGWRQIGFLRAVALALVGDVADRVDAQATEHVARPAAAFGFERHELLGCEHAASCEGGDVQLKIPLLTKKPKSVLHFPYDMKAGRGLDRWRSGGLRCSTPVRAETHDHDQCGEHVQKTRGAHRNS